ncbi:MAG: 50S ribosomal protein L25 [Gammaproteobacteria bacterium]|nr:50S ribosomal protein L25 [Gammaproteobacteria bacterium]
MQQFEIIAEKRADQGKGASRRLRRAGKAPGILYGGGGEPQSIAVSNNQMMLHLAHEAFYSRILTLKLDGAAERVVLKDLQRHPFKPMVLHVDLMRVDERKKLTMRVPLHFLNGSTCAGVKTGGGVISHLMTDIEISCLPKDLPEFIAVDLGAMNVGDTLHISDLRLPDGVEPVGDAEQGVVSCHLPKVVVEEAPVEAEAGAAVATAPAGAPAATAAAAAPAAKAEAKK